MIYHQFDWNMLGWGLLIGLLLRQTWDTLKLSRKERKR